MENQADALDNRTDGVDTKAENDAENRADTVRSAGENKAGVMENTADAVRK